MLDSCCWAAGTDVFLHQALFSLQRSFTLWGIAGKAVLALGVMAIFVMGALVRSQVRHGGRSRRRVRPRRDQDAALRWPERRPVSRA